MEIFRTGKVAHRDKLTTNYIVGMC